MYIYVLLSFIIGIIILKVIPQVNFTSTKDFFFFLKKNNLEKIEQDKNK